VEAGFAGLAARSALRRCPLRLPPPASISSSDASGNDTPRTPRSGLHLAEPRAELPLARRSAASGSCRACATGWRWRRADRLVSSSARDRSPVRPTRPRGAVHLVDLVEHVGGLGPVELTRRRARSTRRPAAAPAASRHAAERRLAFGASGAFARQRALGAFRASQRSTTWPLVSSSSPWPRSNTCGWRRTSLSAMPSTTSPIESGPPPRMREKHRLEEEVAQLFAEVLRRPARSHRALRGPLAHEGAQRRRRLPRSQGSRRARRRRMISTRRSAQPGGGSLAPC
jgi:hypothetical protein